MQDDVVILAKAQGTQLRETAKEERQRKSEESSCHHYPELKGQKHLVLSGGRELISGR